MYISQALLYAQFCFTVNTNYLQNWMWMMWHLWIEPTMSTDTHDWVFPLISRLLTIHTSLSTLATGISTSWQLPHWGHNDPVW